MKKHGTKIIIGVVILIGIIAGFSIIKLNDDGKFTMKDNLMVGKPESFLKEFNNKTETFEYATLFAIQESRTLKGTELLEYTTNFKNGYRLTFITKRTDLDNNIYGISIEQEANAGDPISLNKYVSEIIKLINPSANEENIKAINEVLRTDAYDIESLKPAQTEFGGVNYELELFKGEELSRMAINVIFNEEIFKNYKEVRQQKR